MTNNNEDILTSSYDYFLPKNQIATHPVSPKENAKLLVYVKNEDKIYHHTFKDLAKILPQCSIIFNDTKVIKARIYGKKISGGECELFLNKTLPNNEFIAQIKGKIKENEYLFFDNNLKALIKKKYTDGTRLVEFYTNDTMLTTAQVYDILNQIGHVPLPPYIKRNDEKSDENDYQSIFAKVDGAVAAPTASLHFSNNMIEDIKKNHDIYKITLHVGAGTFKGVDCENILEHKIHSEFYSIDAKTSELIQSDEKILGVGTTVARTVEYFARTKQQNGECDLFLHPQNRPIRLDYLLTNFHLPKSTLIMLVASFIGRKNTLKIYEEAIKYNYRFYSYGDGMLII